MKTQFKSTLDLDLKEEGVTFYNCSFKCNSEVSKAFSIGKFINLQAPYGRLEKMNDLFLYLSYKLTLTDIELITREKGNFDEYERRPVNSVKNYWAIVAEALCLYANRPAIQEVLKQPDLSLPFVYLKSGGGVSYLYEDKKVITYNVVHKRLKYATIIKQIATLIQEDKFTKEEITKLIKSYMVTENLYEGLTNIEVE